MLLSCFFKCLTRSEGCTRMEMSFPTALSLFLTSLSLAMRLSGRLLISVRNQLHRDCPSTPVAFGGSPSVAAKPFGTTSLISAQFPTATSPRGSPSNFLLRTNTRPYGNLLIMNSTCNPLHSSSLKLVFLRIRVKIRGEPDETLSF